MAMIQSDEFRKGRDRIVRIQDATTARLTASDGVGVAYTTPITAGIYLRGLITANFSMSPNVQEFTLLGDDGYRDSVATGMAGELACSAYFTGPDDGSIDPAFQLILDAEANRDKEIYVEVLTYIGEDSSNNHKYWARAFNSAVTGASETAAGDGLIEMSWTFQSKGQIYVGTLDSGTSKIDPFA